jgi:biotin carboxylase
VPCARRCLAETAATAREFAAATGFPIVVKPPAGAGAAGTYRLDDAPALCEEFLSGAEHSFDSVAIDGRLVFWSVSR